MVKGELQDEKLTFTKLTKSCEICIKCSVQLRVRQMDRQYDNVRELGYLEGIYENDSLVCEDEDRIL